ncbi:arginine-glutamic acid dipeptide repeats protein-like isoform X2 [Salvelinus fontinalis]|uniref:arginine-glutamic acid dipeptide repeats protein-like isoform X2 n=1 Tax=Salvelinus fontinalis TaxID=8038 RepID=UPI0024863A8A|nr:arginine-glutamic acid dipeptide repeats protein-like isoform X2 [Salvelinus fontinalis]
MADRTDDDDVIHLVSFNIHRSQGRRERRRNFITISDDSDEEPVTLDPDDDVSILEPLNPSRRRVIRPAALWGVASEGDGPIIELKEVEGHQTAPLPSRSQYRERDTSAPSTSQYRERDSSAPSTSQYRDRDSSAPSTSQYRDRDTSAPSTSQYRDTSAPSTSQYRDRDSSAPSTSQYRDRDSSAPSTSQYRERDSSAPSTSQYRERDSSAPSTSQYRDTSAPSTSQYRDRDTSAPSTSQYRDRDSSAPSTSQYRDRDTSAPSTSQYRDRDSSAPSTSQYRERDSSAPSTSQYRERDSSAPSTSQYRERDSSAPSTSQYRERDSSAPSTSQYRERDSSAPSTSQYRERDTSAPSTSQYRDTSAPSTSQYRDRDSSAPSTSQYRDPSAPSTSQYRERDPSAPSTSQYRERDTSAPSTSQYRERDSSAPSTSQYRDRDSSAPSTSQYRDRDSSAPSTSQYRERDSSAPSTSQYRERDTSAPSTSTQTRPQPFTRPVLQEVKLVLLPQVQPPAPPQPHARPRSPLQQLHPGPLNQPRSPLQQLHPGPLNQPHARPRSPLQQLHPGPLNQPHARPRSPLQQLHPGPLNQPHARPRSPLQQLHPGPLNQPHARPRSPLQQLHPGPLNQPHARPRSPLQQLHPGPLNQPHARPQSPLQQLHPGPLNQPHVQPRSPLQQLHPGPLNQPPLEPQALLLTQPPPEPQALLLTHAFQMQQPRTLHLQPVPQVAPQPVPAPQRWPAGPCGVPAPAVLIAAAPERLGPPETGHRITLGSQTPGGLDPRPGAPLLTHNRPLPLEPQVVVDRPATQPHFPIPALAVPLNPNPIVPAPVVPVVPVVPRAAEERAGPSVQQEVQEPERPHLQPHVRALVRGVVDLFPDVQENYVAELIQTNDLKDLNVICNMLLENPAVPQRKSSVSVAHSSILLEPCDDISQSAEDLFDYGSLSQVGPEAAMQAADLLMGDFRMISCQDIKWSLNAMKGHYAITRKALCEAVKQFQDSESLEKRRRRRHTAERCYIDFKYQHGSVKLERRMYFLEKNRRGCRTYGAALDPSLHREITFYQQKAKEHAEHEDFLLALQVNEEEYEKDGQLIECGCCCGEFAFEKMTQCSDGHLFCKECLVKYAEEAVFGSGQSSLSCMEGDCSCSFPVCELEKVLPETVLCKYYERQAEEAVAASCADELVRCPSCNFPALLDKGVSLFSCPNPRCRKESCRKCRVQWKEHAGKSCDQVMERDEIRMRVAFEERMTAARVRKCVKCGTGPN